MSSVSLQVRQAWSEAIASYDFNFCISLAPTRLDLYPRGLTGHVAHPGRSIVSRSFPRLRSHAAHRPRLRLDFPSYFLFDQSKDPL